MRALLTALALFAATPALAAPTVDDLKAEVKMDKKILKDSKRDLKAIEKLQKKWFKATAKDKENKIAKVDAKLEDWMADELAENRRDRKLAKREFVQMGGNMAALEPAVPNPGRRARRVKTVTTPKRAQDDLTDLKRIIGHQEQTRDIADNIRGIQPAFTHGTAGNQLKATKATLLEGLVVGAKRDVKRAVKELEEDEAHLARRSR